MFLKVIKKVPMGWPLAGEEQNADDVAIKVAVMWVKSERYMETGWRRPDPGGNRSASADDNRNSNKDEARSGSTGLQST